MNPIDSRIAFNYKATGTLHVCLLDEKWMCKGEEDNKLPILLNEGDIIVENFNSRKAYIKVGNLSPDRSVEVTTLFHSKR